MNAHLTSFFVIGQDLDSGIASPKAITFEGFGSDMLVKRKDSLIKNICKELYF
jgi:hypothetical protein